MLDVGGKRKGRVAARVQHGSLGAAGRVARKQMGQNRCLLAKVISYVVRSVIFLVGMDWREFRNSKDK